MSAHRPAAPWALALVIAALAGPAVADDAPATPGTSARPPARDPAAAGATAAAGERTGRIRASHSVEVIAPGERVESIVDRMRAEQAGPAAKDSRIPAPPPVRGPDRRGERAGMEGFQPGPGGAGGAGGMYGPGPPMRGDAPPPDRPRR